ncbi:hypothetical protein NKJ87_26925 [Mesorhizobium sp. M0027]|uniref:hypothetical protein n=1 Tax=unclassified Mesorhizobium TaxID=325217 RepID=UPI0003CE357A|nr:hypothetical protein [Mesorhizobium sp. LSHC420B00]ESX80898.1 hypothetical protein X759_10675 [Mesorhizobium sp. LSHC420B00]
MAAPGATTTSSAVARDVSFQETAKRIYTAEIRRKAVIRTLGLPKTDLDHELSTGGVCTERGKIRCSA